MTERLKKEIASRLSELKVPNPEDCPAVAAWLKDPSGILVVHDGPEESIATHVGTKYGQPPPPPIYKTLGICE